MKKNRAFLKWAGGKYPLIDVIRRHLPEGEVLVEPFVGAGTVFLNTNYQRYILADINQDLINLYKIIQKKSGSFITDARVFFNQTYNTPESYYALRNEFNGSIDKYYRALLFLYLNRHGYNGLCRYNKQGHFNVPFGRYQKPYFPEQEILYFAQKAQQATFFCENYVKTLQRATQGAVVYCDPPYVPLSLTANFTAYYANHFDLAEQLKLAKLAKRVANKCINVLISNSDTILTRDWYSKAAKLYVVEGRRTISRNALGRGKINELLALFASK